MAPNWKQPRCSSTGEWLNKVWYIHTKQYYPAIKRNQLLIYSIWMNLQRNMLSEKKVC